MAAVSREEPAAATYLGLAAKFSVPSHRILPRTSPKVAMPTRRQAPGSPKSLSGDHQRSLCSNGPAGSGQRKKRRHPIARVKGNWLPDEDERLRACVSSPDPCHQAIIQPLCPPAPPLGGFVSAIKGTQVSREPGDDDGRFVCTNVLIIHALRIFQWPVRHLRTFLLITCARLCCRLVKSEGEGQWSVIAKAFPGRIGKQCRERWHNQLRPDIKREAWTDDEEIILIGCHLRLGNKCGLCNASQDVIRR